MMFNKVKFCMVAMCLIIATNACNSDTNGTTYEVGKIKYIIGFPKQIDLSGNQVELAPQSYGCKWIAAIADTILLLESPDGSRGYFHAYSTNRDEYVGSFTKKGRGPGEYPNSPQLLSTEHPNVVCLANSYTGETVYKNLDSLVKFGQAIAINKGPSEVLKGGFSSLEYIDASIRIVKRVYSSENNKDYSAYIIVKDTIILRDVKIFETNGRGDKSLDIAAMCTAYSPITKKIFCALCDFNQINVYTLSGKDEFTICVSKNKKLYTKQDFNNTSRVTKKYFYDAAVCSDKYLFALYYNLPAIEYEMNKGAFPVIQVFTLEGKPVAELKVKEKLSDIEFDPRRNRIYGFTREEKLFFYNLSEIQLE